MSALSEVLKRRRKELGLTLGQIAEQMGVAEATVQRWESGNIKTARYEKLVRLAEILRVSPSSLMGWSDDSSLPDNVSALPEMRKIPLVGQIACGLPILAEENIEDYVDLPTHIRADYALTCKGYSMINAGIQDGDVVYIRKQQEVENGQIAAVRVDQEDATLKRFYFSNSVVQLIAENPKVPPQIFAGEEINRVRVVGLAVAFTHVIH